jgi:hypothetical protein
MPEWKHTTGEITHSEVGLLEGETLERPVIRWTYEVDGKRYEGKSPENVGIAWTQQVLDKFPVGQRVTVRYNPNRPEQSTIEGLNRAIYGPAAAIFLGLIIVGGVITFIVWLLNM